MRLFTAVDLDAQARAHIAVEQKRLSRSFSKDERPKFVHPDLLHVTLVFLGDVEAARVARVVEAMGDIAYPTFAIGFGGIAVLPPRGAPRVLTLSVCEGSGPMIELQEIVALRLEAIGVAREPRPYHPHLTLARWSRSHRSQGRTPSFRDGGGRAGFGRSETREIAHVDVTCVTLYESRLSSGEGAEGRYIPLTRARLTCP